MSSRRQYRAVAGPLAVLGIFFLGTRFDILEPLPEPLGLSGAPVGMISWNNDDWFVLAGALERSAAEGRDALPFPELVTVIGRELVGTPYEPYTLEQEGSELLVVNLRALDCVTFIENVFAISVLVKTGAITRVEDRAAVEAEYERALRAIRYRDNSIDGYASRLHYFSDWIGNGESKGLMVDLTAQLGGRRVETPVDFMSNHPESYAQLSDPDELERILDVERRLSLQPRFMIPADEIADIASSIQDGDVIAATSTVDGLDIAHTGLAVWVDDQLHLMHAPLVGDSVRISERPLIQRIQDIEGQDGIMVARLTEPRALPRVR